MAPMAWIDYELSFILLICINIKWHNMADFERGSSQLLHSLFYVYQTAHYLITYL